jgi:hypothetical protein
MSDILSAICPLRVQKLSKKQRKRIFVYCFKMPYFRDFLHISTSHEKCAEIFNSRTGHTDIRLLRVLAKCVEIHVRLLKSICYSVVSYRKEHKR